MCVGLCVGGKKKVGCRKWHVSNILIFRFLILKYIKMENIKTNNKYWNDLSDSECITELNKFDLISLKSVLWGDTALKYLRQVKSGKIKFSQIQMELRFLVTSSLAFLFEKLQEPVVKGLNVYILECGLSFKTYPIIEHGYSKKIIKNKKIRECEWILTNNVFDCCGSPFRKTDRENTYIRRFRSGRYEIAIISDIQPKITQKEVRFLIENKYKFSRICC